MRKFSEDEANRLKYRLLAVMSRHIGRSNAIGMGELFSEIFGESWTHRINDTRKLRVLVSMAKEEGTPILSTCASSGGGYYLANSASEIEAFYEGRRKAAIRVLALEARMRRIAMPELLGQIAANL